MPPSDSSWQPFQVVEVRNSSRGIWGMRACYFNVSSKKQSIWQQGWEPLMTCLLFKYLYFFLCDGKLLPPKNTLLKVGARYSQWIPWFLPNLAKTFQHQPKWDYVGTCPNCHVALSVCLWQARLQRAADFRKPGMSSCLSCPSSHNLPQTEYVVDVPSAPSLC